MKIESFEYKLAEIKTESFNTDYSVFDFASTANSYTLQTLYFADDEIQSILLKHTIGFYQIQDKPFMTLEAKFVFALEKQSWGHFMTDQNTLTLPLDVGQLFNNISLGTCRGIIHAKTENTPLNKVILPPIVLDSIVKSNLQFVFPKV